MFTNEELNMQIDMTAAEVIKNGRDQTSIDCCYVRVAVPKIFLRASFSSFLA